ncbi:3753_t:CDS:2, partial [Scutellospora calospora]
ILSYYTKKINEKTEITELQPGSKLYIQIQNDDRLGSWHIKELKDIIKKRGNILIENFKTVIINEKDHEKINRYIETLKKVNVFFLENKDEFKKELDILHSKLKIINDSKINPNILNNNISIIFKKRKKNYIKLKPIHISFILPIKKSIEFILKRYNKIIDSNNETSTKHLYKIISENLKHYKESFYIKPWKSVIYNENIKSKSYDCVNYDTHNKIIEDCKIGNISNYIHSETKNNFDGLFNIIWDDLLKKYNLMTRPEYLNAFNEYSDYVDTQNMNKDSYIFEMSYDRFKYLLENDKKNIIDYCESGKYEKIINKNNSLKKYTIELHKIRNDICKEMLISLPLKEKFFKNIMNDDTIDLSMYKGFIYSSLRNKDVVYELEDETVINLEKKRLKFLEESSTINWFKWWRFLLDNPDNLNIVDKYWLFNSVNEMNGKTKDTSFYKKIGYTYVNGLKKCNQEHEDVCTSEILKSIESEIDCSSLTTNGLYNSLLSNEYFNKLIKFNIDEINEIRVNLEKRKNQLKDYCEVEFLIDEFSTNNRFENFMGNSVYEPFFWNSNSYSFSNDEKKIIKDSNIFSKRLKDKRKIHEKYIEDDGPIKSLIQKVNIPEYNKKILENRRLEILHDDLRDNRILSTEQKENISTLIQNKLSDISQATKPSIDLFDELKKEIEDIDKDNADKLLDNENLDKKIDNSNLPNDDIDELQEKRREKLLNFRNKLQDKILRRRENLFPITPPIDENLIFHEIRNLITDVDTNVISEVKNLLDNENIDKRIKNSKISYNLINELQTLRRNKLDESRQKSFNELNKEIDRSKKEDLDKIDTLINNNEILLNKEKQTLVDRITKIREKINGYETEIKDSEMINEVDNVFNKLSTDKTLPSEVKHGFIKIQEDRKTEILQKENNEKYDIIKDDIDRFLTPETLDKYIWMKNILLLETQRQNYTNLEMIE